jgi:hypothetical protein
MTRRMSYEGSTIVCGLETREGNKRIPTKRHYRRLLQRKRVKQGRHRPTNRQLVYLNNQAGGKSALPRIRLEDLVRMGDRRLLYGCYSWAWPCFLAFMRHLTVFHTRLRQRKSIDRHACILGVALHSLRYGGERCWDEFVRR